MSAPATPEEQVRFGLTAALARLGENVVSTECPNCHTRFAMLARYVALPDDAPAGAPHWLLRCTGCGQRCTGDLKGVTYG